MKSTLIFMLWLILHSFTLFSQDIIYQIVCEKDGANTYLDSILFYNLSNSTSFKIENLPVQSSYDINLSSQQMEASTSFNNKLNEVINVTRIFPGTIAFNLLQKHIKYVDIFIYNLKGQIVYNIHLDEREIEDLFSINLPNNEYYIIQINSGIGSSSIKAIGSDHIKDFSYGWIPERNYYKLKTAYINEYDNFHVRIGDTLKIISYVNGYNSYPKFITADYSDTLSLTIETNPDSFFKINGIQQKLNLGSYLWLSELDCGNYDVYAHGITLTSDITYLKTGDNQSGMGIFLKGIGNILHFYMLSKDSIIKPGVYFFVDNVDCNGMVTDDTGSYRMADSDKYIAASLETSFFTYYAINVNLDIDWESIDFDDPPQDVLEKYNSWINSMKGIKEGKVEIKIEGDIYTITIDCTDYNGNIITGKYTGELEYVEFGI